MSSNKIIASKLLGSILRSGKELELRAATQTTHWTRPAVIAGEAMRDGAIKAIEGSGKALPKNTARLVVREADHSSENDPKDHYTVVLEDKDGNYIKTEHFDKK
ncbi:hypothetical protein LTR17_018359 [Elasticomyces elasticus]|nr:hypothetical protein LTR22_027015 [Elasticomyces elasticus]KAK4893191.1 hypothetical protein LTR49_028516 [Elasticomyces elasticus]KAK5711484.1 hypothetical protein LTR17_018359 [Elasticomyces elasticus]